MSFLDNSGKGNDIRSRFVLSSKGKGGSVLGGSRAGRVKGENTVVPMYSDFFSRANGNMMVTANMYEMLHKEIQSVVATYPAKEKILLNVYVDSKSVTELDMEGLAIGFRRYITANRKRATYMLKRHFISTFVLFVVGTAMKYLFLVSGWISLDALTESLIDIVAELLIWQFAAFAAIDLVGEIRKIRRLAQIETIEFSFKHWE